MPLAPNALERLMLITLNQAPAPMFDIMAMVAFRTVLAAVRLGVFEALEQSPLTPAELARKLNADERGIRVLLETLAPLGYVRQRQGRCENTPMTTKWKDILVPGFEYWGDIFYRMWDDLEDTIRNGEPARNLYRWIEHQPATSAYFQEYMIGIARLASGEIVRKLKLPEGTLRLLDIGGGHADYSIAFCRRYSSLQATVFDSPTPLQTAREHIAEEGMSERIAVQEGNFLADNLGQDYDVALLINIVHGFSAEQNQGLVQRTADAVKAGGMVVILEQIAGKTPMPIAQAMNQLLGISFYHLLGGYIYEYDDLTNWLRSAGCNALRRINLLVAPGSAIVVGIKSG